MTRKLLKDEAGYSLVEVMASIILLTVAIIPMVGMFDMSLNAATRASNHDIARALANKQLEQSQSLPYNTVRTSFPNAPCTFDGSGLCEAQDLFVPEDPNDPDDDVDGDGLDDEYDVFRYAIRKQYVEPNIDPITGEVSYPDSVDGSDTGLMQVSVEVGWGGDAFDDNTYTAADIKAR